LNGPSRQGHFYPLPGIQVRLDDRGCLVVHALHLGIPPVITNDLARLETDGGFTITGRYDEVINSGGVKVQPRRVEAAAEQALSALGIRCRYFAIGVPDEQLHQAVCLVLEGSPLPTTVEDTLKENLSRLLGKYEVPREIYYSAHFTETATQKVDRQGSLATARK
jgi:O-succinylbenzoic acid--CoA ligase